MRGKVVSYSQRADQLYLDEGESLAVSGLKVNVFSLLLTWLSGRKQLKADPTACFLTGNTLFYLTTTNVAITAFSSFKLWCSISFSDLTLVKNNSNSNYKPPIKQPWKQRKQNKIQVLVDMKKSLVSLATECSSILRTRK